MDQLLHSPPELAIVRNFFALRLPQSYPLRSEQLQVALLVHILDSALLTRYPPSNAFQLQFWKAVIQHLESAPDLEEVDARLYDHLLSLMSVGTNDASITHLSGPPPPSFITYIWQHPSTRELVTTTLLEARTTIEAGTTGLRTWGASLAMSQYLQTHRDVVHRKRVLELGCGVGLLGIVASRLGARTMLLTDCNTEVLEGCRDNVRRAQNVEPGAEVKFSPLDWSDSLSSSSQAGLVQAVRAWDVEVVLGADIASHRTLTRTLRVVLSASPRLKEALIALTLRREDTFDGFISALVAAELHVRVEDLRPDPQGDFMCSAGDLDAASMFRLVRISKE